MIYVLVYIYIKCAKHLWKGTKETYISLATSEEETVLGQRDGVAIFPLSSHLLPFKL